jgi:hypothetical protein
VETRCRRRASLRLRRHLKLARVERVELHEDFDADADGSGGSRRADFHSVRRLFCTSLAVAGVNIQTAMELAGHRRAETAMRYVKLAKNMMAAPSASKRAVRADKAPGPKPPADTADTGIVGVGVRMLNGHLLLALRAGSRALVTFTEISERAARSLDRPQPTLADQITIAT